MFCARCGRSAPEGARYCPNCGAAVTAVSAPSAEPTLGESATASPAPPNPHAPPETPYSGPPAPAAPGPPLTPWYTPPGSGPPPAFDPPAYGPPVFAAGIPPVAPPAYAGFWRRVCATFVDSVLLNVLMSPLYLAWLWPAMIAAGGQSDPQDMDPAVAFAMMGTLFSFIAISGVISMLYFALLESSPNQASLGKMAMGLKLTDPAGKRITFGHSIVRRLARIVTGFTIGIGYLMVLWTRRKQTLHDLMVGTLVVRK